jgi:hypothetical protein
MEMHMLMHAQEKEAGRGFREVKRIALNEEVGTKTTRHINQRPGY